MDSWSGTMDITADYGQRVYEYTVSFTGSREEGTVLTMLSVGKLIGFFMTRFKAAVLRFIQK